jgi:copper chaperone
MTATQRYQVTGMTCQHCVRAVTGELTRLGGVSSVEVGLVPGGESVVTVASQSPLADQMIAAALDEAGDYRLAGRDRGASR